MGRVWNPSSEECKELSKWEQHNSQYTGFPGQEGYNPPGNPAPATPRPYPKMLYRAQKHPRSGKVLCLDMAPHPMHYTDMAQYDRATLEVESFNAGCTKIVQNETEHANQRGHGWRDTAHEALAHFEAMEQEIAQAAAEANFRARGMSAKAQTEFAAAHGETSLHVTDVVGTPRSRRGRPRKSNAVAPEPVQQSQTPTEAGRE